jgi:predicted nucleic acid-binding protein
MRVFFDTSALTKRYVEEEGSEQFLSRPSAALKLIP